MGSGLPHELDEKNKIGEVISIQIPFFIWALQLIQSKHIKEKFYSFLSSAKLST